MQAVERWTDEGTAPGGEGEGEAAQDAEIVKRIRERCPDNRYEGGSDEELIELFKRNKQVLNRSDMRRRAAMFWMLHEAGASYAAIARAAGLSKSRVHQVCQSYAYQLHRRSESVTGGEPFMERLRRARALLGAAKRQGGAILGPRFEPYYP